MVSSRISKLLAPTQQVICAQLGSQPVPIDQAAGHYCAEQCYRAGSEEQCKDRTQCLGLYLDQHFGTEEENPHLDLNPSY